MLLKQTHTVAILNNTLKTEEVNKTNKQTKKQCKLLLQTL